MTLHDVDGTEYPTAAEWMREVERRARIRHPERFVESVREAIDAQGVQPIEEDERDD